MWQGLTESQRSKVKAVCLDFWKTYFLGVGRYAPNSDIVHERFHVSKYLNEAVDKVRENEYRQLAISKSVILMGTKYL